MPIAIEQLIKAAEPLSLRIGRFLSQNSTQAFSTLEIIAAIEEIPPAEVPGLILAQRQALDESPLLSTYERALYDLEHDVHSPFPVISAEHGGTWFFGLKPEAK